MKEYMVTAHSVQEFMAKIQDELSEEPVLLITSKSPRTGKWGMARLWRSWMATTAEFMSHRGVRLDIRNGDGQIIDSQPFDAESAHELFTKKWLGVDENGMRLSWARGNRDGMRAATRGERYDALRRHESWASDKGIDLFHPRDSEYREVEAEQNA